MKKTIGILAHVDAGKTTLSEAVLYHGKVIRAKGRVDHQDSFLDADAVEKQRGITVFSGQAAFSLGENQYYLVDTPGHVDFAGEMERTLGVLDYAVLVVSASDGIQGHTATLWRLLEKNRIPVFFFLNKTDQPGADVEKVLAELREQFSPNIYPFPPEGLEPLAEDLAALDEKLLDCYLDTGYDEKLWYERTTDLIEGRQVFPCFSGSALNDQGVIEFLNQMDRLAKTEYEKKRDEPFCGRVYQVRHDEKGNRISFLKVLSGVLTVKEEVATLEGSQKIDELRHYQGMKFQTGKAAEAGSLCGVTGLLVRPGEQIGEAPCRLGLETTPTLTAKVEYDENVPAKTVLEEFKILEAEEPLLNVSWEERLKEIRVHILGTVQLEILQELMAERFHRNIGFGECQVAYRETIGNTVLGCGHFEPLRHYAEVHLALSPGAKGSGITFESRCPLDQLDRNYQNLIRTHVFEREQKGVLIGAPITDVKVTLLAGKAHERHTEGGDFREAVYRALRQGLMQAESILLEPWYAFQIQAESQLLGRILSDIQRLQGVFEPPQQQENRVTVNGRGPAACFMNYSRDLAAFSQGKGLFSFRFDGYEPCQNQEELVAQFSYDPEADVEYTPDSVFCSHGAGYPVKWSQAQEHMHLKVSLPGKVL